MTKCAVPTLFSIAAILVVACSSGSSPDESSAGSTGGTATGGVAPAAGGGGSGATATGGVAPATGGGGSGATGTGGVAPATGGGGLGGVAGEPRSCAPGGPGLTDCGSANESCCTTILVPGGTFHRTYTNDGTGATDLADPATISDFRLDKYIVTVGRYRQFVAAWDGGAGYTPPVGSGKHVHLNDGSGLTDSARDGSYEAGWTQEDDDNLAPTTENLKCESDDATWTDSPGDNERLPMNCVNWWEAYAFCIWDGGFLPSEAEFEYAAAGGSEQRRYPWGSEEPGVDNQYAIYDCNYPAEDGVCSGIASVAPVGTAELGSGRWGHLDLVAAMMQWNLDYFAPSYGNPCDDCAYLTGGSGRVIRDGYFAGGIATLLVPYRNSLYATNRFNSFGFRCARTP